MNNTKRTPAYEAARRRDQNAFTQGAVAFRAYGVNARNPFDLVHEPNEHDAWNRGFTNAVNDAATRRS